MFEKEGYEWTVKNISVGISMFNPSIEMYCGKAFKDGAEFGYNLAKEEIDYLNKHWGSEEERKANEWHDLVANPNDLPPKEEHKLPSDCKNYYVIWFGKNNFSGAKFINGKFCDGEFVYYPDEIVAWKEIVLPELKESV